MTDILILQYNNADYTVKLLESIKKYTKDYRVIFIDNASQKEELEKVKVVLKTMPHILIENEENLGFVKGQNMAIARSTADYICIQNNDTEVEEGWLYKLLEVFKEHPNAGAVGPTTIIADSWQNKENVLKVWGELPRVSRINGMLAFFCTVIKREVIQKVGYLSEEYGIGFGDDDDYCERMKEAGFELYLRGDVIVPHYHRSTFKLVGGSWEEDKQRNLEYFKKKWNK